MRTGGRCAPGTGAIVTQEEYSAVCPYLGLADDADSHATYATEAHRCFRLPNPTRIATPHQEKHCLGANHVTCPVYLGEGVPTGPATTQRQPAFPGAAPAAGAAAAGAAAGASAAGEPAVRGPRPGQQRPRTQAETRAKRPPAGALGPRPRSGGISMPVATIGLFALAIVVVGLAFLIQNMVGGGGDDTVSPADTVATAAALNKTRTAQAGGGDQTQSPGQTTTQPAGSGTPGTPAGTGTRPAGTQTPGAGGDTYTVQSGDFCGTIAADKGISLQDLLDANDMSEADCSNLQVGQILKLP